MATNDFFGADDRASSLGRRDIDLDLEKLKRLNPQIDPIGGSRQASPGTQPSSRTGVLGGQLDQAEKLSAFARQGNGISTPDNRMDHLYPVFREKLQRVLTEVAQLTGEPWTLVEGYRSEARQTYLYAQGRTRPGPVVTWMRSPKYHGTGLAADVMPVNSGYRAPRSHWETLRSVYHKHGLENPAWSKGDLGHIQLSDPSTRADAQRWVANGFQY